MDRYSGSHTSGTLVQKTTTSYSYGSGGGAQYGFGNVEINVVPNAITTTDVLSGKVSQVTKTFDTGVPDGNSAAGGNILYGALLSENHYDWGNGSPGNLLRQTNTQYMALTGPNSSYYLGDNLLSLPYTVQVQNGAGAQASLLQYNYDEYSLVSSGVTTQRDTSPPNAPYRGNQTSVHRWLNSSTTATTNCNISVSNGYLVSYAVYNDTGTVDHSVDSCGSGASDTNHTSSYAYSLTYAGAYPTAITNPLGQTAATAYDFNTGRLTSATDPNQQTTNYTYDNMWGIVSASYPDGGSSTITHQESSFPFSATLTKALNSSQNYAETNIFDGFGRVAHHQITSDPQGTVYADTAYDADGRVATVSNPYRSTGDSTYGTASTTYDALNRPTSVTRPDNSIVHTAYCGPTTLVTDEANHWRRSTTDALGRLIEVDEPNSVTATVNSNGCPGTNEPIWVTTYGYDALDGLTGVVQGGSRNRSFLFDSVKHLTSSTNPEAGTVTYGYDANSNVVTKTDARSITVTHSYDPLNRITAITYSNSDPSLSYAYDQATCIGQSPCYNVGRRTTMSDAGGTENLSYDKMGREWGELRTTNGSAKTTTYTYDLAGDLTALTYPSGRTITYTYDSAGRPSDAIDAADGIDYVTGSCSNGASSPSTGACYAPQDAVAQIQNGANLISTYIYNDRLQPCWIYATTGTALSTNTLCTASATVGNIFDLKYSFNLGSGDNGNVMGITNNRDTTRSQSFAYDHVNRILSGQTSATTGPNCWGETYSYDQWANLLSIGAVSGYTGCTQENLSVSATLSNQITFVGASYDASGNMLADGANSYTYNAESEISTAAGVNYTYDADGNRVEKSNGKIYWYGAGTEILNESDLSGNFTNEYVFFAGKRVARWDLTSAYSALPGTGTATIGGSEQSIPGTSAAPGTGTVTISGTERSRSIFSKVCNCLVTTYDSGTVSIIVNGHADSATYGQNSASSSIASALVSAINVDSAAVVTASASGSTVTLTAKTTGPSTNYSLSASVTSQNGFSPPSFTATPSGSTLTGGANYSPTVYDSGSVWVTVNGFQAAANYGQGDTAASVASAIANVFNTTSSSPVTATVSGATLTLTARTAGSSTNFSLASGSSTSQGSFSSPSFTTSTSGPTLTGGRDAGSGNIYYYLEDLLGSSRTIVQAGQTSPCYDADFYPFGGERVVTSSCPQNYRFEGKERDSETGNDDFGARYYSSRFGRWLSADWSAIPAPVPYANLTNPQTLNLYAMVSDNPETFADLDGHTNTVVSSVFGDPANADAGGACVISDPTCTAEQEKVASPPPPQEQQPPKNDPCPCISQNAAVILSNAGKEAAVGVKAAMVVTSPQYAFMAGAAVVEAAPTVSTATSQVTTAVNTATTSAYVQATTALSAAGAAIQNGYQSAVNLAKQAAVTVDTLRSGGGAINAARDIVQAATSNRTPPAPNKFGAAGLAIKIAIKLLFP